MNYKKQKQAVFSLELDSLGLEKTRAPLLGSD